MDLILTVIIALKLQKENIEIHEVTRFGGRVRLLGPAHTYPVIFEAATFSFRIRLSSTHIRRIRKQIRKFLNPLSRVEIF